MKTYILDSFNRLKSYSKALDAKAVLCNKAWLIFNTEGNKEVWKFKQDGTMSIAHNGEFQIYNWNYDTTDNSVNIMKSDTTGICIKPVVYNGFVLGFRQDGTEHDMVMIEERKLIEYAIHTAEELRELERRILIQAYSQTPEGRAEHAQEIDIWEAEQRKAKEEQKEKELQEKERLKALSVSLVQQFEENLDNERKDLYTKAKGFHHQFSDYKRIYIPIILAIIVWIPALFIDNFSPISCFLSLICVFFMMAIIFYYDTTVSKTKGILTKLYGSFLTQKSLSNEEIEKLKKMAWFYTAFDPDNPLNFSNKKETTNKSC